MPHPPSTLLPLALAVSLATPAMAATSWTPDAGVTVGQRYDDNVFAQRERRRDDLVTVVSPFAELVGESARHRLRFYGGAERGRYHEFDSENYTDWRLGAEGRLAYSATGSVFGSLEHAREHEARSSADAVNGREPTLYLRDSALIGVNQSFGRLTTRLGGTWSSLDFDDVPGLDGVTLDNDDRDRDQSTLGGRVGYALSERLEPFVQAAADLREYDQARDDAGYDRDSLGGNAALGLIYRPSPGLKAELLAGWLTQDYDDPALDDVDALDVGGELTWQAPGSPSRVAVRLDRSVEETTERGASASLRTALEASLTSAVRPDLTLTTATGYSDHDYQGVSRNDHLLSLGMGLRHYLNPYLYVGVDYDFLQRDSSLESEDFDRHRIDLSLGAQFARGYDESALLAAAGRNRLGQGFYLGAQGGLATLGTSQAGPRGAGGSLLADFRDAGSQAGLFGGYALALDDWRLGLELETDEARSDWQHDRSDAEGRDFAVEKQRDIGLAMRLGHRLAGGHEVYGRAGLARGRFETDYAHDGDDRREEWLDGRRIGGGLEVPLATALGLRMDYTVTHYDDLDVGTDPADDFAIEESLMRLGLIWHPGRDAPETAPNGPEAYAGPYVGVHAGYGDLLTDLDGPRDASSELEAGFGDAGSLAGAFAGVGATWDRLYLAAEVHGEFSDMTWNHQREPSGRSYSVDRESSLGVALRAGYVIDSGALLYLRGGPTWTDFETRYERGHHRIHQDDTERGWQLGGGLEVPIQQSLHLRMDYTQTRYDAIEVGEDRLDSEDSAVRMGLSYRF
ncbi:outer membrane beta-barrel protein [Halomonas getboli]|uniref:outer membrane beta-barrel protein n=1 Tax=Halomonas getboli TaxID=2935862 RepID=UPI001FFF9871|nr:outer membrane beta-barrel protein [Halomonas getboli]MCK2184715.1 outer membrane beta-barrel protein [Halomonas getboli]